MGVRVHREAARPEGVIPASSTKSLLLTEEAFLLEFYPLFILKTLEDVHNCLLIKPVLVMVILMFSM